MNSRVESQFDAALESLISVGIGLIQAIVVVVVARYLHRFIRDRLLRRLESTNLSESDRTVIGVLTTIVFVIISATLLLALWGVTWSGIVAAISLGTLGILLGIQDLLRSLIGGIFLILERPYSIGDRISVRDVTGRVIGIELRTTIIRSDDGHRVVAPNSIVFTDTMTNYSLRRQIRTHLVLTGISGDAIELKRTIEQAVIEVVGVDGSVEVEVKEFKRRITTPRGEEAAETRKTSPQGIKRTDVSVSWLGGGEPEVQAAVIARLREIHPNATLRTRRVRGIVVPSSVPTH